MIGKAWLRTGRESRTPGSATRWNHLWSGAPVGGGRERRDLSRPALAALALVCAIVVGASPARAEAGSVYNEGRAWLASGRICQAPSIWRAERLFLSSGLPRALADLCLYSWNGPAPTRPSSVDLVELAAAVASSGATNLTEDVPVVYPMSAPEVVAGGFQLGLRDALVQQVGSAQLLPSWPQARPVRIAVIDSAPDSPHAQIQLGASRHGDTLAHLIEEVVCEPLACDGACTQAELSARRCVADVTTELALPWTLRGERGASGGHIGTLSDLARAIERSIRRWQDAGGRQKLVINLSVGWEHTAQIAECSASPPMFPPAQAVQGILQYAASKGALIVAAAGNDSGGPTPRTGLLCPAAYQAVGQTAAPTRPLLVAASGVDYSDLPLETTRPQGVAAFAAPGLGGVAWVPGQPMPPQLVGSSVSAAVVTAVHAVLWAARPLASASQIQSLVYSGGLVLGPAQACPLGQPGCSSRRVSVCGALLVAGVSSTCVTPSPKAVSCPVLASELDTLEAYYAGAIDTPATEQSPFLEEALPRKVHPTVQVQPSVFPQPISATCPTCWVSAEANSLVPSRRFTIPSLGEKLSSLVLVVRLVDGSVHGVTLGDPEAVFNPDTPYAFTLPSGWVIRAAYLTGITDAGYSTTEQIFIEP